MKTLIIYQSIHHGNTEKVAKKIAEVLGADLRKPSEVKPEDLAGYDLIGFGSGVYAWRFHASILKLMRELPAQAGKKAFIFSTSGGPGKRINDKAAEILVSKGFAIVGSFNCIGWDTFGPLALFGGMGKGRPNEKDLSAAAAFAEGFKNTR
jgi:flavodoxin